jgi:hypothetical protein
MGHVACNGTDERTKYKILVRKPEAKKHLGDLGIDERIILR